MKFDYRVSDATLARCQGYLEVTFDVLGITEGHTMHRDAMATFVCGLPVVIFVTSGFCFRTLRPLGPWQFCLLHATLSSQVLVLGPSGEPWIIPSCARSPGGR